MFRTASKRKAATKAIVRRDTGLVIDILVVDDDPGDARIADIEFRNAGLQNHVFHAENGQEALRILRDHGAHPEIPKPGLILMDLHMPMMDGHETLRAIRSNPETRDVPVVMLTVSNEDEMLLKSYELRADCFLSKPFDYRKLRQAIDLLDELTVIGVDG